MRAFAHLSVERAWTGGAERTRVARLHSDPPLILRPTHLAGAEPLQCWNLTGRSVARVSLVAGAAGPIGGDDFRMSVDVGEGAALVLRSVAATLALPGPHALPSRNEVDVYVAANGICVWLPGPLIAAQGCHHQAVTRVTLEPGARLIVREELLLGRHGEQPGNVRQRLRVSLGDGPLYDQELAFGPETVGWDGPAVTGGRRAVGSLLVVDPDLDDDLVNLLTAATEVDAALLRLTGPAVLMTALAHDGHALRQRLTASLAKVEASLAHVCS